MWIFCERFLSVFVLPMDFKHPDGVGARRCGEGSFRDVEFAVRFSMVALRAGQRDDQREGKEVH